MGALPYKINRNYISREPYRAKRINGCVVYAMQLFYLCEYKGDYMQKLDLYYIDLKYIRDLSKIDDNVMSI